MRLFSENVALDEPFARRRRTIELLRRRIGEFRDDPGRPAEFDSPAHCRWWLRGSRGVAAAEIRLTPERHPRVQSFSVALPPAPGAPLARALAWLAAAVDDGAASGAAPVSGVLDAELLERQLRTARAWAGRCRPGALRSGDGERFASVEFDGEAAGLILQVAVAPDGLLWQADIALRR